MIRTRPGLVTKIREKAPGITWVDLEMENGSAKGINFDEITGPIQVGHHVVANTTAVHLGLGSGGWHFIMSIQGQDSLDTGNEGHIMKLRYTPMQLKVLSVEEPASPYHTIMKEKQELDGMPVIVGGLHSQLAPAVMGAKEQNPSLRIAYIMTDAAALPTSFSKIAAQLKQEGYLTGTISIGHAFGGDLEAVNIYSGLIAARWVLDAQLAIVCMGPGTVGTQTPLGSTSLEQACILDAVNALGGRGIGLLRISFADNRQRHQGISHHCLTALGRLTHSRSTVVMPLINDVQKVALLDQQLELISSKHGVVRSDGRPGLLALEKTAWKVSTMGRNIGQDREFFLSACASGHYSASLLT